VGVKLWRTALGGSSAFDAHVDINVWTLMSCRPASSALCGGLAWHEIDNVRRRGSTAHSVISSSGEQSHMLSNKLLEGSSGLAGYSLDSVGDD
jgi:hypothetical protein